ncbi:unnamed protein product [Phytophthora fragariaefolia]|uniref:Unnamed protein product n=1 Tax=Phytophthora fragariaefolia TaxID=1490495 RepID=A0A9W6U5I7_9STRA|nr:unnamed protein product [Phytophthora fragariaefolia]
MNERSKCQRCDAIERLWTAGQLTSSDTTHVRRQDYDGEETKQGGPLDENNPDDDHGDYGNPLPEIRKQVGGSDDGSPMAPAAVLAGALQQMEATMTRIVARLDQLDTAAAASSNPVVRVAPTPAGSQRVKYPSRKNDGDGGDSGYSNGPLSSSDGDDESNTSENGGRPPEWRHPRPDKAMAEWRVGLRRMMPGETYADFAAALSGLCGNNRMKERVLLLHFYSSLDRTTRLLVKRRPKPRTLEVTVGKATAINDPIVNVVQGMEYIGQAFVTIGTTGQIASIPGVVSTDVAEEESWDVSQTREACTTNTLAYGSL